MSLIHRRDNLRGISLMVAAMAGFAVMDLFVKSAARDIPVGQILVIAGAGGGVVFAILSKVSGIAVLSRDFFLWPVLLRNASEILGSICYITALSLIDLSTASAILQATPLAVTLGAVLLLGEVVHWRRWSAIAVGFIGVLIILRPATREFDPATLWAVAGMFMLALRDLATRMAPKNIPTLRISTYGMAMLMPAGLLLLAIGEGPRAMSLLNVAQMLGAVGISVLGYWAITEAMRTGDVAVVAPFRYSRIIFALLVGIIALGERPDFWTLIGAAITIAAGVYAFLRERRVA